MSGIVQHRQASAQAILVFMAGLLASVLVFMYLTEVEAESAESVFVAESADRAIDIEHHVQTLNQKLNSLVSFFEASKEVTEEEFIRFVQHAFDLEHDKSFRYLAWYPLRTKSAVTNLPEPLNARFVLGSLPGPNRFPKNILSMPGAHTALIEAIRTESASVSQVISHPVFGPEGVGALVFYPVFDLHDSVGKHHGLRGMLLGVIEMAETISGENVISRRVAQDPKGLDIYVYDNDARASVADPVYIHHSRARVLKAPSLNIEKAAQGLFFRYDIAFGNQTWTIIARALHGRMGVDIGTWMSLISSVFASFVVAVLWFIYARRNQTVKELVATRTQALQDREAHLNAIVESAVDAIITIDEAGGILTFNKSAERIFGYADVEVVGRNIKCLMPENTAQQHDGYLDAYKRTGEKKIIGVGRREIARRKDGSEFPIDLSISEFFSGNRKMYAGIIRDISDRIATENKMKKSETRYKMMLENAADAIYLHDGQGQIVDVNEHACDSVGYSREELTHMSVFELDSSFSPGALLELWNENGAQNFPISLLSSHRRKNGEVFPIEVNIGLAEIRNGTPLFVAIVRDITEREEAQREMARLVRELKLLAECNEAVLSATTQSELLERVCRVMVTHGELMLAWAGYAQEDKLGTVKPVANYGFEDGYVDKVNITWRDNDEKSRGPSGTAIRERRSVVSNDVENDPAFSPWRQDAVARGYHACLGIPLLDGDKAFGVIVVYHKQVNGFDEQAIRVLQQAVDNVATGLVAMDALSEAQFARAEADKANAAKSEFLSAMSHELRTPLNAILGFAQLLEMDLADENLKADVDQILRAGKHLLNLINEILDLAKIEAGRVSLSIENVNVSMVLDECFTLIKPMAESRGIRIEDGLQGETGILVRADYTRFKQVLLNLLSNAVKYNREKGVISIDKNNDLTRVRLMISDTGLGLSEQQLGQLFRPFERVGAEETEIEGTGIGLVITKRLVELMGGQIGVESTEGKGSTFWVELPLAMEIENDIDVISDAVAYEGNVENISTQIRILYVEDNPANLLFVKKALERQGNYHLVSAPNASLGIEMALNEPPDIILMDINLPGMNGFKALEQLKLHEQTKHIPVIALSANAMPRDIEKGIKAGFQDYLTKPVDVHALYKALQKSA